MSKPQLPSARAKRRFQPGPERDAIIQTIAERIRSRRDEHPHSLRRWVADQFDLGPTNVARFICEARLLNKRNQGLPLASLPGSKDLQHAVAQSNPQATAQAPSETPRLIVRFKHYLQYCYGCSDSERRQCNPRDTNIPIDDRKDTDVPALFCDIWVTFSEAHPGSFLLSLQKAPNSPEIQAMVVGRDGSYTADGSRAGFTVSLTLCPNDIAYLRKLATAIRQLVSRKREDRYEDSNWKWVCGRTSKSLTHFACILANFRKQPDGTLMEPLHPDPRVPASPSGKIRSRSAPPAVAEDESLFKLLGHGAAPRHSTGKSHLQDAFEASGRDMRFRTTAGRTDDLFAILAPRE